MIAFQIEGLINLFYIIFCLWYLTKAVNFVFQKNWTFTKYLSIILKYVVILELIFQLAFQVPVAWLHPENFGNHTGRPVLNWQKIIGLISIWRINPLTGLPENTNITNLVLKCLMYAFIILQENIFLSEEYEYFIKKTLSNIRSFSDRKTESMAYLYNNKKLKITVKNQFEKDKMMRKLVMVNRQVKKWNETVFSKSTNKKELEEETRRELAPKEETKTQKIHEVDERLEEDRVNSGALESPIRGQTLNMEEAKMQTEESKRRDKEKTKEEKRKTMTKSQLVKSLVKEKCNIIWKVMILITRH